MKKNFFAFLVLFIIILNPLSVQATDVEPITTEDSTEEGGDNQDDQNTSQPVFVEVSKDVIPYQKGDIPYVVQQDNVVISFSVIHADGTVSPMSEEQFNAYYLDYIERTGDEEPHFGRVEDFMQERQKITLDNAGSKEEGILRLAIQVTRLSDMPPRENIQWTPIEIDGTTHYIYVNMNNGKYYEVDEALYNHYQQEGRNWYNHDMVIDNGAIGYGTSRFTFNVSERVQGNVLVLTIFNYFDSTTESIIVNPPYNVTMALEKGKYRVEEVCLYDSYEYPLEYDKVEFTVEEYKAITIALNVNDPLDQVNIAPPSAEEMAAINSEYHSAEGEKVVPDSSTPVEGITTPDNSEVVEKKSSGMIVILTIGVTVLVVGGLVGYYIYRKKQYEY